MRQFLMLPSSLLSFSTSPLLLVVLLRCHFLLARVLQRPLPQADIYVQKLTLAELKPWCFEVWPGVFILDTGHGAQCHPHCGTSPGRTCPVDGYPAPDLYLEPWADPKGRWLRNLHPSSIPIQNWEFPLFRSSQ